MFTKIVFFSALVLCTVVAQEEAAHPAPEPYAFTYESPNEDGSSSARQETGDAQGVITGFYIIKGADGQDRRVDYVADENGFRAEVSTSELGTETHEAANAVYRSSAPSVAQLIAQWESSGAAQAASARRKESSISTTSLRGGALRGSILTETRPASLQTAKIETVRTEGARVTPEGYVLVPASAARQAGIATIGGEISSLQGLNLGGSARIGGGGSQFQTIRTLSTESRPLTTSSSSTRTVGTTRFLSGVTGGLTGSLFNERNQRK